MIADLVPARAEGPEPRSVALLSEIRADRKQRKRQMMCAGQRLEAFERDVVHGRGPATRRRRQAVDRVVVVDLVEVDGNGAQHRGAEPNAPGRGFHPTRGRERPARQPARCCVGLLGATP